MAKTFSSNQIAKVLQYNDDLIAKNKDVYRVINDKVCEFNGKQFNNVDVLEKAVLVYRKGSPFARKENKEWILNGRT